MQHTIIKKTIQLGKVDYNGTGRKNYAVDIEVELDEAGELHMSGNIWNTTRSDIVQAGQCQDTIAKFFPQDKKVQRMIEVWNEYHLNHMHAGTPAQEKLIEEHQDSFEHYPKSHYEQARALLEEHDLLVDNGYKYGSAWLKQELPAEIVEEVASW
jgi:hypothetical protein